jgi:hemolysin D
VVQSFDQGRVIKLAVENGARVKAGDLLIEFDPTESAADERTLSDALIALRAEMARRTAGILAIRDRLAVINVDTKVSWDDTIPQPVRRREQDLLAAELRQLADTLENLNRQIAQRQATHDRFTASIAHQLQLVETLDSRVALRNTLFKQGAGPKTNLLDAEETLRRAQSALVSDQGQLKEADAAIAELVSQKVKTVSQFMAGYEQKRGDAERKAEDTEQQLNKARARLARTKLATPIDGTVQQLAITTVGQVALSGQQLMIIVPSEEPLQIEVYMSNSEIGFVALNQDAVIKVDAFPFTRYGMLHGRVVKIALDAIDEQDARRAQANATSLMNSANINPPTGQPQNFVFPVTLSLEERAFKIEATNVPLMPGMTVTAEIKTESRRVIDYLFSPLAKVASEALRER